MTVVEQQPAVFPESTKEHYVRGPMPQSSLEKTADAPNTSVIDNAVFERVTFANEETGYAVVKVALKGSGDDLLTVVGPLAGAQPGESLRLVGWWKSHPQFGKQFEVRNFTTVLPATIQGIRRYLGSGLIKGVGPKIAERIVGHFELDTLRVIEEDPSRLVEVPGLGPKRSDSIADAWETQKAIKEVMIFLQGVGVSTSLAVRIFKKYADASISIVRNEPYRLASDVWGIGFKTADVIAQHVGIPHDSPQRVKAGIQFTLSEASGDGHCFLPQPDLIKQAREFLEVDASLITSCLDEPAGEDEGIAREQLMMTGSNEPVTACYLVPFHRAEVSLSSSLRALQNAKGDRLGVFQKADWDGAVSWFERTSGQTLAPEQAEAV